MGTISMSIFTWMSKRNDVTTQCTSDKCDESEDALEWLFRQKR